jgi:hypothetical protein
MNRNSERGRTDYEDLLQRVYEGKNTEKSSDDQPGGLLF